MKALQAKYPEDLFELTISRISDGWRVKCSDCPGKVRTLLHSLWWMFFNYVRLQLYTPGPNETLGNFEVHLKNRQHRMKVIDRLNFTATAN
jgi:SWI/SNF-related matrix-associated actin-dependent regulator of chromatin subfamily B member 1